MGVGDSHGAISGNRAIELPNIPTIAGGCVAGIGLLSVHCLIAAQFAQRADLEIRAYFILWLPGGCGRAPASACLSRAGRHTRLAVSGPSVSTACAWRCWSALSCGVSCWAGSTDASRRTPPMAALRLSAFVTSPCPAQKVAQSSSFAACAAL